MWVIFMLFFKSICGFWVKFAHSEITSQFYDRTSALSVRFIYRALLSKIYILSFVVVIFTQQCFMHYGKFSHFESTFTKIVMIIFGHFKHINGLNKTLKSTANLF